MPASSGSDANPARTGDRIRDARGRSVPQLDPVRLHLLNQASIIPAETLRAISDGVMPDARRQRAMAILAAVFTALFIVGGTAIYFRYFGVWRGFDAVGLTINAVQVIVILAGPLIAFRMARTKYVARIRTVMLEHGHCPHCGYNLRDLPPDPADGATICPECGCAWRIPDDAAATESTRRDRTTRDPDR